MLPPTPGAAFPAATVAPPITPTVSTEQSEDTITSNQDSDITPSMEDSSSHGE
jgi:hypothetical protein